MSDDVAGEIGGVSWMGDSAGDRRGVVIREGDGDVNGDDSLDESLGVSE